MEKKFLNAESLYQEKLNQMIRVLEGTAHFDLEDPDPFCHLQISKKEKSEEVKRSNQQKTGGAL